MPVILNVNELKPGMRLFHAVFRDNQVMLPAGNVLEEWEINSLRRRLPNLTVQIGDPVLDDFAEFEDDGKNQEVAFTVTKQIGKLMTTVRDKLSTQTSLSAADISGLQGTITAMISFINENPVTAAMLVRSGDWNSYLQEHCGNVFYISLLVGNAIREYVYRERQRTTHAKDLAIRYGMDLTPLGLGCMFHDIGMLPIEYIYTKDKPLTDEEREMIRNHPTAGAESLPPEFAPVAKMVVRTHHENYDGTGYPDGIKKEKLHVFSRVIRIVDAYDAGTSNRIYRHKKCAARILWELSAGPHKHHFDPTIARILLHLVQPFPIGARVRINTGQWAVVIRHDRQQPFRPHIIVAYDEEGKKLQKSQLKPPIRLSKHDKIRLVEYAGDDLSFLNNGPDADGEWSKAKTETTPEEAESLSSDLFEMVYP